MPFRTYAEGDLVDTDIYDGNTDYTTIEAYEVSDKVNKADQNRPLRNLFENNIETYNFGQYIAQFTGMKIGVLKDSLTSEFTFDGDSDIFSITVASAGGDTTMYYTRLAPGVAVVDGQSVVSRPQTHIAERQLEDIFSLDSWNDEGVQITYYYTTDKFQVRITRRDINGTPQDYDFVNGGSWGDSADGYDTGLAMLNAIYGDSINFRDELEDAVGIDLTQIELEPVKHITDGDSIWWIARSTGVIEGDTKAGDSVDLDLCHFTVAGGGDSYSVLTDDRTYLQHYNDVGRYLYLNVPQEWGDTDTQDVIDPYGDSILDYSVVTNQNTLITFIRKSTGDTQDNSLFGWYEDTIPDLDETRSDKFFMNKDLLVLFGDSFGDTLGKRWASIGELSGDSWQFYGDKTFNDGFFKHDGTSASFTESAEFAIDSGDSVRIDADSGIFIGENSGALISVNDSGRVDIDAASGQIVDITGDTVIITTDELDLSGVTLISGDTININGDSINIDSTGEVNIAADVGITIDENSGSHIGITTDGQVDIDAVAGQIVQVTGDTIQLDAVNSTKIDSDVDINGNVEISGTMTIGDTVACLFGDTSDVTDVVGDSYGGAQGTYHNGSFTAFKVYNAIWNDYAEAFEFNNVEKPKPGLVYKQTRGGLMKTEKKAEKATVGIYSDTAAMILGSKGVITEQKLDGTKIPIGLAGKVKVFVVEKLEIGDLLMGGKNGIAKKANIIDRVFRQDRVIGKVLESSDDIKTKRIWMLIK